MLFDMKHALAKNDIPKNPARRREWIKGELRLRGTSLRQLALAIGVAPQSMSATLTQPLSHLEPVIADALGVTVEELFPERFENGHRLYQVRPQQRNTKRCSSNVKNTEAA